MTLIVNTPGKRGLTEEGSKAFLTAYRSTNIFEAKRPTVRFPREAADIIRQVSDLRRKNWRSTDRWNETADCVGLLGELSVMRYLGIPAGEALTDFTHGLAGDKGYDLLAGAERIDVKSTRSRAKKFKFSKQNPNRDKSSAYCFVFIEDSGLEVWATILGWSLRHQIKPWVRDDGRALFVRAETLHREGLLHSVSTLKQSVNKEESTCNTSAT